MKRLLIVDDEPSICWGLCQLGRSLGYSVQTAGSVEQALREVVESPDMMVLDVRLPGMDGLTALEEFRRRWPDVTVIVITAHGDLETAVTAVKRGAFEYVTKPFDLDTMERTLQRAAAHEASQHDPQDYVDAPSGMVGSSARMQHVFKQIALAANSDASVLLYGESGTGKELAARAIHQYGDRSERPFVAVNVAALNPQLAESELFGHVRGAFTGADVDRDGLLTRANHGTLFLDEIADVPLSLQVKLLRALEHGEVLPVGANEVASTDCRVISATHQNLAARVDCGEFRHDLFFRLNTFVIDLPPLRERPEDIPALAQYFLARSGPSERIAPPKLSEATLKELRSRAWYGNVRELRNAMEHAMIVSRGGRIEPEHLPPPAAQPAYLRPETDASVESRLHAALIAWTQTTLDAAQETDCVYERLLQAVEPAVLQEVINRHHGQCASAARQLGIHRTTLRKKLDQYGIEGE